MNWFEKVLFGNKEVLVPVLERLSLPPMDPTHHKYQRGFVIGFGGSKEFPGAIKLSGLAALHAGAGIVKLFYIEEIGPVENELIAQLWTEEKWHEALERAQAVFIGPGLGRSEKAKQWLEHHLASISQPCVIDADALFFLPELSFWPKKAILTPHRGEMAHLLGRNGQNEDELLRACQTFVDAKDVILVLKGVPTFIFSQGSLPIMIARGDPGMATAGSGDVLTGIIAAILAQGKPPLEGTILSVILHDLAGEAAAKAKTSYGYTASDLISHLPDAFRHFM